MCCFIFYYYLPVLFVLYVWICKLTCVDSLYGAQKIANLRISNFNQSIAIALQLEVASAIAYYRFCLHYI